MPPQLRASIVVPVFHNEGSLPFLCNQLDDLAKQCKQNNISLEVVFVDDDSQDDSLATLLRIKAEKHFYKIKILHLARNFGSTVAIRTGIKHITGDCVITLSADLQDPPGIITRMLDGWLQGNKFVICTRLTREDPISTKIFSFLFYRFIRGFILSDYPQGGFDLALMDKDILPFLSSSSSQLFTPIQVYSMGFRPKVIYYHREKRIHGKSKWTFGKKLSLFVDIALSFSRKPARLLSLSGIIIAVISFMYGIYVVAWALLMGTSVPGFAATISSVSILSSVIITLLSLTIEYLSRIFYILSSQPEVVIEEAYD